ncbi:MAG: hypothetical protein ACE3JQ_00170 [Paenisporosarcina sp.]
MLNTFFSSEKIKQTSIQNSHFNIPEKQRIFSDYIRQEQNDVIKVKELIKDKLIRI